MKAIIVAGGRGRRLAPLTDALPKPLVPLGGQPLLAWHLDLLRRHGITDVTIASHYRSETIEQFIGDGSRFGVRVTVCRERNPRGSAGAVRDITRGWQEDVLVLYGDVLVDMDLDRLRARHGASGAAVTVVVHPNDHPADSDLVDVGADGRITAWHVKPHPPGAWRRNLVGGGVFVLRPGVLRDISPDGEIDFGRNVFPTLVAQVPLTGYRTAEYLKDIGTPERLREAEADIQLGRPARERWGTPRPAVFLDRDGVINAYVDQLHRLDQLSLLPRAAEAIRSLNRQGILTIVITNQPAVARGLCTLTDVDRFHAKLETLLGETGAYLHAIYVCPHHPDRGFPGERPEFKIDCTCRKPKTDLVEQAIREWSVDRARSAFVGDGRRDIECGWNAGLFTIGVRTGVGCRDSPVAPDALVADLTEAVTLALDRLATTENGPVAVVRVGRDRYKRITHRARTDGSPDAPGA